MAPEAAATLEAQPVAEATIAPTPAPSPPRRGRAPLTPLFGTPIVCGHRMIELRESTRPGCALEVIVVYKRDRGDTDEVRTFCGLRRERIPQLIEALQDALVEIDRKQASAAPVAASAPPARPSHGWSEETATRAASAYTRDVEAGGRAPGVPRGRTAPEVGS